VNIVTGDRDELAAVLGTHQDVGLCFSLYIYYYYFSFFNIATLWYFGGSSEGCGLIRCLAARSYKNVVTDGGNDGWLRNPVGLECSVIKTRIITFSSGV
jgi:hypothetical protein